MPFFTLLAKVDPLLAAPEATRVYPPWAAPKTTEAAECRHADAKTAKSFALFTALVQTFRVPTAWRNPRWTPMPDSASFRPRADILMKKNHALKNPPAVPIDGVIHTIRGERVILDADLAAIYGVKTKALNQAVKRNHEKFPPDFLLELTNAEAANLQRTRKQEDTILRSQIVTLKQGHHLKYRPFAFTEHGALMAANILNSPQAVQMSVFVIRAFIRMRGLLTDTRELAKKLASLETELKSRLDSHETAIVEVLQRVMLLLDPPPGPDVPDKQMGFHTTMPKPRK